MGSAAIQDVINNGLALENPGEKAKPNSYPMTQRGGGLHLAHHLLGSPESSLCEKVRAREKARKSWREGGMGRV